MIYAAENFNLLMISLDFMENCLANPLLIIQKINVCKKINF